MPDDSARKMVDAAIEKNAVEFKSSMEDSMNERIATQLRDRKMEIANNMFSEEDAKDMQVKIVDKKKKEAAMDQNVIAKKGSSPVKG
jgi:predicted metal-dependent peptidase